MTRQKLLQLVNSDLVKLVPILGLAFYISFIPHLHYPYAIHIDEWVHISYANTLLNEGTINIIDPFTGQQASAWWVSVLELGYHLPLSIFQRLSGISWMTIARYAPSIIFMITVLSVYVFTRRMGFGWESAFFTCFIPTTVGILGPSFLVPVSLGLTFAAVIFFLVFNFESFSSYATICILLAFTVILHATSALLIIMMLVPYLLISFKVNIRRGLIMVIIVILPLLISLPWTIDLIAPRIASLFVQQSIPAYHDLLFILTEFGQLSAILCLIGVFSLALKGGWKNYSLIGALLIIAAMLTTFYSLHYGVSDVYFRGLLFAMLIMGTIAGSGLMVIRKLKFSWGKPIFPRLLSVLLCLLIIGVTLATTIPHRQQDNYYHMIDSVDYEAFLWIKENVDTDYQTAILDPWKATAFNAITGKYVYNRIDIAPTATSQVVYDFLQGGSENTTFLKENGINIIYTRVYNGNANIAFSTNNSDLIEVRENLYLLKEM